MNEFILPQSHRFSFVLGPLIGEGNYGNVYQHKTDPKKAIKILKRKNLETINVMKNEIALLAHLNDVSGVVKLFDFDMNCGFVMEKIDIDLLKFLKNFKPSMDLKKKIISQILKIFIDLHDRKIVHFDVKTENFMIDVKTFQITLIDFGFGVNIRTNQVGNYNCGSLYFMPYDIFYSQTKSMFHYCGIPKLVKSTFDYVSSEIYCLGVVFYTVLFEEFPFSIDEKVSCLRDNVPFPTLDLKAEKHIIGEKDILSLSILDFLKSFSHHEEGKRTSLRQAYQHSFLKSENEILCKSESSSSVFSCPEFLPSSPENSIIENENNNNNNTDDFMKIFKMHFEKLFSAFDPDECIQVNERILLFKCLKVCDSKHPHLLSSSYVKKLLDYDLAYTYSKLSFWENRERAERIKKNILLFMNETINIENKSAISFYDHCFIFFCISILLSDYPIEHIIKVYAELNHPISFEIELKEQQHYQYIFHVEEFSKKVFGITRKAPSFELNQKDVNVAVFLCSLNEGITADHSLDTIRNTFNILFRKNKSVKYTDKNENL